MEIFGKIKRQAEKIESLKKTIEERDAEILRLNKGMNKRAVERNNLRARVVKLREENANLKEWYRSIMAAIENSGIAYYRCGECGGPVASGMCCSWCRSTDPVTLPESFYDRVKSLEAEIEQKDIALEGAKIALENIEAIAQAQSGEVNGKGGG